MIIMKKKEKKILMLMLMLINKGMVLINIINFKEGLILYKTYCI